MYDSQQQNMFHIKVCLYDISIRGGGKGATVPSWAWSFLSFVPFFLSFVPFSLDLFLIPEKALFLKNLAPPSPPPLWLKSCGRPCQGYFMRCFLTKGCEPTQNTFFVNTLGSYRNKNPPWRRQKGNIISLLNLNTGKHRHWQFLHISTSPSP